MITLHDITHIACLNGEHTLFLEMPSFSLATSASRRCCACCLEALSLCQLIYLSLQLCHRLHQQHMLCIRPTQWYGLVSECSKHECPARYALPPALFL